MLLVAVAAAALLAPAPDPPGGPPASARPAVGPEPQAADLEVAAGLAITTWAETPLLRNPTAIDVDAEGRVWVAEAVNYRQWDGRNPGRHQPEGDRIVVLADTDGDGSADRSTVFAQDEDLVAPLGVAVLGDRVLVACSPAIYEYRDTDGDGVADARSVLLTGFGGHDHDHGVHSPVFGPDGRLLLAVGNAGPHLVTDRNGFALRSGSLYREGGARPADNRPGLVSDDGRVWTGGLLLALDAGGGGLSVLAHDFRNPYEAAVDAFGERWLTDNDDDGNQGCRAVAVLEGGDYGFFSAGGTRTWQADRRPGQPTARAHWHQDDPGVAPTTAITGAGGPTGVAVYEGTLLPARRGHVLAADAGRNCVFDLAPEVDGAGFRLDVGVLVAARAGHDHGSAADGDRAHWFRPSDVAVGPDGALFVADWHDPGVGGHLAGDREAAGRILRIAPVGHVASVPALALDTTAGQAAALCSPAPAVRALGWQALERAGEQALPALVALHEGDDPIAAARAAWLLARIPAGAERLWAELGAPNATDGTARRARDGSPAGEAAPTDPDGPAGEAGAEPTHPDGPAGEARADTAGARPPSVSAVDARRRLVVAVRALAAAGASRAALAAALVDADDLALRREAAVLLRDAGASAAPLRRRLLVRGHAGDRVLLEALGAMLDAHPDEVPEALLPLLGDDPLAWTPALAELAWRLHPEALTAAWAARASAAGLPAAAREQALAALAFTPGRAAAEAVLAAALAGPADTRELATFWVRHRDGNDWRAYDLARHLGLQDFGADDLRYDSGPVSRGAVLVDVDVAGARHLGLVVSEADNGKACDWADWLEPMLSGPGGAWSLAQEGWLAATTGWGEVRRGSNCEGGPLSVDGVVHADGIGTHAPSRIVFAVPEGASRFTALVAVDDGGTRQPGAPTRVRFQVYADRPQEVDPLRPDKALVAGAPTGGDDTGTPAGAGGRGNATPLQATGAPVDAGTAATPQAAADAPDDERAEAREEAAARLAADPEGAQWLLALARDGRLDAALHDAVAEVIFTNPDLGVRAVAGEHFRRPGASVELPPLDELLRLPGDPLRGRAVFVSDAAGCLRCHVFDGRGGDVGPELTAIRGKLGPRELLDALLHPSAAIAFGYEAQVFRLADGRVLTGFLLADGERLLVKDAQGRRVTLEREQVAERWPQTRSLMPDNVALGLSAQELADLVAFLLEDRTRPAGRGETAALLAPGSLDGWRWISSDPAVPAEAVWRWEDDVLVCAGNPVGYLRTEAAFESFELELEWRFPAGGTPGNSGVLLRVAETDEIWPRSLEAQLLHRTAGDLFVIGGYDALTDPGRTSGRRTAGLLPSNERPLGEWNHYRIRLDGPDLLVEVNGEVQNVARWCEQREGPIALQSEGVEIHFRDVRLTPLVRPRP